MLIKLVLAQTDVMPIMSLQGMLVLSKSSNSNDPYANGMHGDVRSQATKLCCCFDGVHAALAG